MDTMDTPTFKESLTATAPPAGVAGPLGGLWWAAKGDWDRAHKAVQDDESRDAAWVHAYLHRVEGDAGNAAYWYGQAKRPVASGALDAERTAIVTALLGAAE